MGLFTQTSEALQRCCSLFIVGKVKKSIDLKDWPSPKRFFSHNLKQGYGHPFVQNIEPFFSNHKKVKKVENMSLLEAAKWSQKFRPKLIAKVRNL